MLATKKDLKALQERIDELTEKDLEVRIENLRNRILKKVDPPFVEWYKWSDFYGFGDTGIHYEPKPLEERLSDNIERIEKRQELLMKYLGLKFVQVDAVDKHEEIRKVKESTPETSSRKKTCMKCGEVKPITEFHRNKTGRDGRRSACRICVREYMHKYLKDYKTIK